MNDINIIITRFKLWLWRTKIHHIFYVYVGSTFHTAYYLIRYKFDMQTIHIKLDQLRKDAQYEFRKEKERHIEIMAELEKKRVKLQRKVDEKIKSKGL